ncbi:MAG: hypothetical protein PHW02_00705 [bacterium]|nr:hypothetical protein [bacterium]
MKRIILFSAFLTLVFGCSLLPTEDRIQGIYTYTGVFVSQKLFNDSTNILGGDTVMTAGMITLNWQTLNAIAGDRIIVEKSVSDSLDYEPIDSVPVNSTGAYIDSIMSGNTYYYKLFLNNNNKNTLMDDYTIVIPQLIINKPMISDTNIHADSFDIVFSSIENNTKYAIKLSNMNGDSIWGVKDLTDTIYTFEAGPILSSGIYSLTVTTTVIDILESQSIVTTTGVTQFYVK